MEEKLISHHIFLFPFQWEFIGKMMKNKTMEDRTKLSELLSYFDMSMWKRNRYSIETALNYNEYNYFYRMAREVLFDQGKEIDKSIITNLFYNIKPDEHFYEFSVCTDERKGIFKTYRLHIESIILHLYSVGVGVLSFHLNNRFDSQGSEQDILNINQFGRRIYPPFFPVDFKVIGGQSQYEYSDFESALGILKKKELASKFSFTKPEVVEDFSPYHRPENFKCNPFQLPRHFKQLFGDVPITVDWNEREADRKKLFINPLIDDRMYVICWYGNTEKSQKLARDSGLRRSGFPVLEFETDDWWYKYVFNDQKSATCQNKEMKNELIRKHTYKRWTDYNTFYGINRYSFVCLTDTLENLKRPPANAPFVVNHMQTIYYKMAELCLVQRACILRFSNEVAGISAMSENKKIPLPHRVSNLYKQYIRYVNRIYFREITAQEQGIEMYGMMQEHMQIEQNVKNLDDEISELHEYAILLEDQSRNRKLTTLSILGAIFLIPTFLAGIYGMNISYLPELKEVGSFIAILTGFLLSPLMAVMAIISDKKRYQYIWILLAVITFLIALIIPFLIK